MAFGGIVGKNTTTYTDEQIQQLVTQGTPFVWSKIAEDTVQIQNGSDGTIQTGQFATFNYTIEPGDFLLFKKVVGNLRMRLQIPNNYQSAQVNIYSNDFNAYNIYGKVFGQISLQAIPQVGSNYFDFSVNSSGFIRINTRYNNWITGSTQPDLQTIYTTVNSWVANDASNKYVDANDYFSISASDGNKFICDSSNSNLTYEVWKCSINLPT